MKAKEIRELAKEDIAKRILDSRVELKNLRFAKVAGENKNPLKRRNTKRLIARMLTIQKEKGWN